MKQILLLVFFAGLIAPAGIHAQKMYRDKVTNRVIFDLTEAAGMPKDAITDTPKTWEGSPSYSDAMLNNLQTSSINATVFQKLEIAPYDIDASGVINGTDEMTMDWVTAFNRCKNSDYDNGGWRLPTQRELILMFIFQPALDNIFAADATTGKTLSPMRYWAGTEINALNAWVVDFQTDYGLTSVYGKSQSKDYRLQARCVREVTD